MTSEWDKLWIEKMEDYEWDCLSNSTQERLVQIKAVGDKLQQENKRLTKKVLFMEEAYGQKAEKLEAIQREVDVYQDTDMTLETWVRWTEENPESTAMSFLGLYKTLKKVLGDP